MNDVFSINTYIRFLTTTNLKYLCQIDTILVDGNFKSCPNSQ